MRDSSIGLSLRLHKLVSILSLLGWRIRFETARFRVMTLILHSVLLNFMLLLDHFNRLRLLLFNILGYSHALKIFLKDSHLNMLILVELGKLFMDGVNIHWRFLSKHCPIVFAFLVSLLPFFLTVIKGTDLRFVTS